MDILIDKTKTQASNQTQISIQAGKLGNKIYVELIKQHGTPEDPYFIKSTNFLCVRLIFCFYADDIGLFGKKGTLQEYLKDFNTTQFRIALLDLFHVLDTPIEKRDSYMNDKLASFPYINGGFFKDMDIEIPQFNDYLRDLILNNLSSKVDWSKINPTIFAGIFESTMNAEERRVGGVHYTSIENIHKVIEPLFINELKEELNKIKQQKDYDVIRKKVLKFQEKISNLTFLDPACGSGNFLIETYIVLRELENEALALLHQDDVLLNTKKALIKVSITQFHGIDVNESAVAVAKTALWIAENQMYEKTKKLIYLKKHHLPMPSKAPLFVKNALTIDWNDVINRNRLDYIIGNPPFIGKKEQTKEQKENLEKLFNPYEIRKLDYVTGWYIKAAQFIKNTDIRVSFVSTNSISRGEQVAILWEPLFNENIEIDFAYESFKWSTDNNSKNTAKVHVVIISFSDSKTNTKEKLIISNNGNKIIAQNINPYLVDAPNVLIKSKTKPISDVPKIIFGNLPIDNGNLILNYEEAKAIVEENKNNTKFIREYAGGNELINNHERYCLWLKDIDPKEYKQSKLIMERIRKNRDYRLSSSRKKTIKMAETPFLFGEIRQPDTEMLVIPKVSSEKRKYIPILYVPPNIIINGSTLIIPNADLYIFGILTSNVHMSWVKTVAGRLKNDYQYSARNVYNTFPWPTLTEEEKLQIEKNAKDILDIRELYSSWSLAELYDEVTVPGELREAHLKNDKAVMEAYKMSKDETSESEIAAKLIKLYENLVIN